jgi:hypothetical protein
MIDTDARSSSFDSLPPGSRDPDPADLDSLTASLDHLALCCSEASGHLPIEAVRRKKRPIAA